jgi:hypothetical protein
MHAQIRSRTAASPPDLAKFIAVLSEPQPSTGPNARRPINIEGISGGGVELDGEVVIVVEHGREDEAMAWLNEADYHPELHEDIYKAALGGGNSPGSLLEHIQNATGLAANTNRVIKDVVIGERTGHPGKFFVQIAFQDIRAG